jgi:hypothetical protein
MEANIKKDRNPKTLVVMLCLFIAALIFLSFLWEKPPGKISLELLVLISFLIILVLSEDFDNFSVNKVFSLSRNLADKEKTNAELRKENGDLKNLLINISNNFNQNQVNNNVTLIPKELADLVMVRRADEPEKEEKRNEAEETIEDKASTRKVVSFSKFEDVALTQFIQSEGFNPHAIVRDAKLVSPIQQIDPISEYSPVFDGYIKNNESENFIELKSIKVGSALREKLYLMLSKINYYKAIRGVNAVLYLVLVVRPNEEELPNGRHNIVVEKVLREFEPAIISGLLQVRHIQISQQEYDTIMASE